MRSICRIAAMPLLAIAIPASARSAGLGSSYSAVEYDYRDFYAIADNRPFRVELVGSPYPDIPASEVARRLLPVMQANKPPPNLTFTYDMTAVRRHPDYRLLLMFYPANDI